MSKFQIKLLTSRINNTNNVVNFLETPISEFYDQLTTYRDLESNFSSRDYVYCYSFDEKISFHTNGQKELSFSMLKNIWQDGELVLNPFIDQLKNGAQILLIDQYDNEYFFTIKDIKYNLKQSNIVYNYSCQDSFTYQHIRQNNGYSIQNNSSESDFIGAKNIDWWVQYKIQPECHITYQYIPLDTGLYLSTTSNNILLYSLNTNLQNVEKIIKHPYSKEEYKEYYESIPFAISGSNASASLIALGDELGLMLNFKEHNLRDSLGNRTSSFVRYFWFEPKRNEKTADLKYSPYSNIQSFSFSHSGASLATSFNIESNTVDDEVISLFPNIPPFFSFLFSSTSWRDSLFTDGFFTVACQKQVFLCKDGLGRDNEFRFSLNLQDKKSVDDWYESSWYDADEGYIYFQIKNTPTGFKIPEYYNKVSLADEFEQSELVINGQHMFGKSSNWDFVVCNFKLDENDQIQLESEKVYNDTYSLLTEDLLNQELTQTLIKTDDSEITIPQCYLRLYVGSSNLASTPNISKIKTILRFYRDATEEELEFAEIADQCPWLENKLLDFSYFVNHQIISPEEYGILMNTLKNNLRIVNGQLMYYSREYYQAIHTKTSVLADLTNTLDAVGAAFNSDVVEAYKTNGSIENIDHFSKAYATMLEKYFKTDTTTPIINYDELLTEYFNKYFNAQQRFFKNIYNFKKFFNQKTHWSGDVALYKNIIKLKSTDVNLEELGDQSRLVKNYWSFQDHRSFMAVSDNFVLYDQVSLKPQVRLFETDKITEILVADKENCKNFYKPKINEGDLIRCTNEKYNPGQLYYRVVYGIESSKIYNQDSFITGWADVIEAEGKKWILYKKDELKTYYSIFKPISTFIQGEGEEWPDSIPYQGERLLKTFLHATYNDIVNEYLYSLLCDDTENSYRNSLIYRSKNTEKSTSEWWSDGNIGENLVKFQKRVLLNSVLHKDWEKELCPTLLFSELNGDPIPNSNEAVAFYKTHFPITSVSYTGPGYRQSKWTWKNGNNYNYDLDYQPINKKKETFNQYIQYLVDLKNRKEVDKVENPLDKSQYITNSIPIASPDTYSQYYYRTPKGGMIALTCVGIALPLILAPFTFGTSLALSAITAWAAMENAWRLDTKWDVKGRNTQDFDGNPFMSGEEEVTYNNFHDSNYIYYTKSSTSYDEWYAINQQRTHAAQITNDIQLVFKNEETPSGYSLWKIIDGVKVCYKNSVYNENTNLYDYFNFYSKIALTYTKARTLASDLTKEGRSLTYTESYLRPVKSKEEKIDHKASYYILFTTEHDDDYDPIIFSSKEDGDRYNIKNCLEGDRLSQVKHYFLYNNMTKLDMSSLEGDEDWQNYGECNENYEFTIKNRKAIIFKLEKYSENFLWNSDWVKEDIEAMRWSIYNGTEVYNKSQNSIVDFTKENNILLGFYQHATKDSGWVKIESEADIVWEASIDDEGDIIKESTKLYTKINTNEYKRVYTINQLKDMNYAWYINNGTYEVESINPQNNYLLKIYLHQETYDIITDDQGNKSLVLDTKLENTYVKEYMADFSLPRAVNPIIDYTVSFVDEDKTYSRKIDFSQNYLLPISNISNGHFWLLYNSSTDHPILFEEAAAIETELTQYWTTAYNASLCCEYFLPPSWQTRVGGSTNYYNQNIITYTSETVGEGDNEQVVFKGVVLSNRYLPDIEIYQENGSIKFPNYQLEHGTNNISYKLSSLNQTSDTTSYQTASNALSNFKPIINALSELNEELSNFTVVNDNLTTNTGKKNYYYNSNPSSGVKWNEFIQEHSNIQTIFSEYSGLYLMMYNILRKQFENRPFERYNTLKNEQNKIWDDLYKKYPGSFLEESYSNKNATTSKELFSLATIAFKDKQEPEKGYSISLINPAQDLLVKDGDSFNYKRYSGQELKIGEGILLNADEYYDNYDDVYKTLSQYLFISDISYNLRKDSDIQVTVNSIKYQDKLIQRLAKLIK